MNRIKQRFQVLCKSSAEKRQRGDYSINHTYSQHLDSENNPFGFNSNMQKQDDVVEDPRYQISFFDAQYKPTEKVKKKAKKIEKKVKRLKKKSELLRMCFMKNLVSGVNRNL